MKFLGLRWHVGAEEHLLVDSVNPGNVEERHRFMRTAFPENGARLEMIELPDPGTADTLPPPADPFSQTSIDRDVRGARAEMPTLSDLSPTPDGGLPDVLEHPANKMARRAIADNTLLDRDRSHNRALTGGKS